MNVLTYAIMSFRKGWTSAKLERGVLDIDGAIDCELFEIFKALDALKQPEDKSTANTPQIVMYKQQLETLRKRAGAYVDRNLYLLWALYDIGVESIECGKHGCGLWICDKAYLLEPAPKFAEVIFHQTNMSIKWRDNRVEFVISNRRY